MKPSKLPILETIATLSLVAIAMTVVTLFFPKPDFGDFATWVGAIGTVAAFAGTIWIASSESRRRREEELTKARLYAASMELKLMHVRAVAISAAQALGDWKEEQGAGIFGALLRAFKETYVLSIDDVLPMAPLPNAVAARLAQVIGQLSAVTIVLEDAVRYKIKLQVKDVQEFSKNLGTTRQHLDMVLDECRRAVKALHHE